MTQLSEKCRRCPYILTCDHKEMEALMYVSKPMQTPFYDLIIGQSTKKIDTNKLETNMYKKLYERLGVINNGA